MKKTKTKKILTEEQIRAKGLIPCDNFETCGNLATRNLQDCCVEWSIDSKGRYSKEPVEYIETSGDNQHLCDDCEI